MMKWRVRKPGTKTRALHWWHDWFAWRPVRVPTKGRMAKQTIVWLQTVRRKGHLSCWLEGSEWHWQYDLKKKD